MQVVGREFPFDISLVLGTPFFDFDTAFRNVREVLQGLDSFDEVLDDIMAVVDGPVILDFRCQCRFEETGYGIEVRPLRIMLRIGVVSIFEMQNDDGDDIAGVGNPVVRVLLAFIICDDVGDVLGR